MKKKTNYYQLLAAILLLLTAQTDGLAFQQEKRPNVILIITDDQGYGDLGIHGNPHVQTPVLDKLGRERALEQFLRVTGLCAYPLQFNDRKVFLADRGTGHL